MWVTLALHNPQTSCEACLEHCSPQDVLHKGQAKPVPADTSVSAKPRPYLCEFAVPEWYVWAPALQCCYDITQ